MHKTLCDGLVYQRLDEWSSHSATIFNDILVRQQLLILVQFQCKSNHFRFCYLEKQSTQVYFETFLQSTIKTWPVPYHWQKTNGEIIENDKILPGLVLVLKYLLYEEKWDACKPCYFSTPLITCFTQIQFVVATLTAFPLISFCIPGG